MSTLAFLVFGVSLCLVLVVFLNPLFLWAVAVFRRPLVLRRDEAHRPEVDFIIVVRNGEGGIERKLRNTLALRYPSEKLRVLVYSDGSTDGTAEKATAVGGESVRVVADPVHDGKNISMNKAVRECSGDVLVFSDADAELRDDALELLVPYFADAQVGGVSGNKVIRGKGGGVAGAQGLYNRFSSALKRIEGRTGSVSTNDGTLYAIRRTLFRPVHPAVTDDLFVCLSVIDQGCRFVYETAATAVIDAPSKSIAHEFRRRRRVVSRSLRGLYINRSVLNVTRHGQVAVSLLCNKVLRRFLPVLLLLLFLSSAALARRHGLIALIFAAQVLAYGVAVLYLVAGAGGRFAKAAAYFLVANGGTLLGLVDFLRGREMAKWNPK